jgi:hypothetical protein
MTKKRAGLAVLTYLATFAGGGVIGAGLCHSFYTQPLVEMLGLMTVSQSDDTAYVAYRHGAYPAARIAILQHIELAQRLAREHEPTFGKGSPADLTIWYGRLAIIAERAGAAKDATDFWRRAVDSAARDGGKVTQAEVRQVVSDLDERWDARLRGAGS